MDRLIDQDTTAFGRPGTTPSTGTIVGLIAPGQDRNLAKGWVPELAILDRIDDAGTWTHKAALGNY